MLKIKRTLVTAMALTTCLMSSSQAAQSWKIVPKDSELKFSVRENNVTLGGSFASFTGEIKFDPAHLDSSKVRIIVNMNSVKSPNPDLEGKLPGADWFDAKVFPQAGYTASNFVSKGKNAAGKESFEAKGTLMLRNKTAPVTLTFTLDEYTPTKAVVTGQTSLKRTVFGVGQGEWGSTDVIEDDVQVSFKITAQSDGK